MKSKWTSWSNNYINFKGEIFNRPCSFRGSLDCLGISSWDNFFLLHSVFCEEPIQQNIIHRQLCLQLFQLFCLVSLYPTSISMQISFATAQ